MSSDEFDKFKLHMQKLIELEDPKLIATTRSSPHITSEFLYHTANSIVHIPANHQELMNNILFDVHEFKSQSTTTHENIERSTVLLVEIRFSLVMQSLLEQCLACIDVELGEQSKLQLDLLQQLAKDEYDIGMYLASMKLDSGDAGAEFSISQIFGKARKLFE